MAIKSFRPVLPRGALVLCLLALPVTAVRAQEPVSAPPRAAAVPAGTLFRDCAECPDMVVIPAGRFVMGVSPDEEARENLAAEFRDRSRPQRVLDVRGFAAGRHEVTRGQYRAFAESTGRTDDGCFVWQGDGFVHDATRNWRNPGYAQDDTHPVVCVSWDDATAYTAWLSQKTRRAYRLLTEAEWEYAARAGTATARYWGDDLRLTCAHANGADRAAAGRVAGADRWLTFDCDDGHAHSAPVGSYRANAFGLHDMLGNVWEWTQDCANRDYEGAPPDARAWTTGDCSLRMVRGGSWEDAALGLRAAYRVGSPTIIRVFIRGFRVAADE